MAINLDAVFRITAEVRDNGLAALGNTISGLEKSADKAKASFKGMIDRSAWQGAAAAAAGMTAGLVLSVKAAIDFESSMSDVRKVVDGLETPAALAEIQAEILGLSETMPIAAKGFAQIYAAAGEAGIPRQEIRAFAEDVAKMAVAFDMTAEEAGSAMAKLRTALGLSQPEVRLLADAMNYLSNNMASSAKEVTEFMLRSGVMGKQAGLTAAQTAAFGSAMIAAGTETTVAATSFNNMVRALTRGESVTARQGDALFKLGLATASAADEEKRLSQAVEIESQRRLDIARRETDETIKQINRRYRDQSTAIQDQADDTNSAFAKIVRDRVKVQVDALRLQETAELEALRKSAERTNVSTLAQEAAIRASYDKRISAIQDAADNELKVQQRASRDALRSINDDLDDRKQIEITAAEDRYKEIVAIEKKNVEEAKIRAKIAAESISKEAGGALAKRMQVDAIGTIRDVFARIKALPKEMQISVISDLFGDEAKGLAPLIDNTELFEKALRLVAVQSDYAGSSADEYAKRLQTTAAAMQLAQNKIENLLIKLGQEGGLLDVMLKLADVAGGAIKAFDGFRETFPAITPLVTGLTVAFVAFVAILPFLASAVTVFTAISTALAGWGGLSAIVTALATTLAGLGTVVAVAFAAIQGVLVAFLGWIGSVLIPGLIAFFSGPVGWTVLAVAAVVAMVVLFREPLMQFASWLWTWGEPVRQFFADLWNGALTFAAEVFAQIPGIVQAGLSAAIAVAYEVFVQPWIDLWALMREPVAALLVWIQETWAGFVGFWGEILSGVVEIWGAAWDGLQEIVSSLVEWLVASWTSFVALWGEILVGIGEAWSGVWGAMQSIVASLTEWLVAAWRSFLGFWGDLLSQVGNAWVQVWQNLQGIVADVVDSVVAAWDGFVDFWASMLDAIGNAWGDLWNGLQDIVGNLVDWLNSAWTAFVSTWRNTLQSVGQVWNNVWGNLRTPIATLVQWVIDTWRGFVTSWTTTFTNIGTFWSTLWGRTLRDPVSSVIAWLVNAWNTVGQNWFDTWKEAGTFWNTLWGVNMRAPITAVVAFFAAAWKAVYTAWNGYIVKPITDSWIAVATFLPKALQSSIDAVQRIITSLAEGVKSVFRGMLVYIAGMVNSVGALINKLIVAYNSLPAPDLPLIPQVSIPSFASGGMVSRPTLAMIGDAGAGNPEYVIPQSRMGQAAVNYLSGARGDAVLQGGRRGTPVAGGSAPIRITTGPVVEFDGRRYASLEDLASVARQTQAQIMATLRTPAGRRAIGVG